MARSRYGFGRVGEPDRFAGGDSMNAGRFLMSDRRDRKSVSLLVCWLNDWIQNDLVPNPEPVGDETKARCSLADARVDVRAVAGKPEYYEAVAYLRPHDQREARSASMGLLAEVPKRE
jgi:predicted component of type VI protein secretion system